MSRVSNVFLCVSILERKDWLEQANLAIAESANGQQFVDMDAEDSKHEFWYGGSKVWEANTAAAAFNYFEPEQVRDCLQGVEWLEPEFVQVIAQDQDDDAFKILTLATPTGGGG